MHCGLNLLKFWCKIFKTGAIYILLCHVFVTILWNKLASKTKTSSKNIKPWIYLYHNKWIYAQPSVNKSSIRLFFTWARFQYGGVKQWKTILMFSIWASLFKISLEEQRKANHVENKHWFCPSSSTLKLWKFLHQQLFVFFLFG